MTQLVQNIPTDIDKCLVDEFLEIKKRFSMNDWGPGQLMGGRFAEAVLRIFQHLLGIAVTPFGTDIPAYEKDKILNAVKSAASIDDHVRQKIVPITRLLLDFRNNRDVAHLGGFNANGMDTLFVMTSATWILCELVRVYGGHSMADAQRIVDGLAVKEYPVIIEIDGEAFITRHDLKSKQEVLVLLSKYDGADAHFLFKKQGDSNRGRFKKTLESMANQKLVAEKGDRYYLLPRGSEVVSKESLLTYA